MGAVLRHTHLNQQPRDSRFPFTGVYQFAGTVRQFGTYGACGSDGLSQTNTRKTESEGLVASDGRLTVIEEWPGSCR